MVLLISAIRELLVEPFIMPLIFQERNTIQCPAHPAPEKEAA